MKGKKTIYNKILSSQIFLISTFAIALIFFATIFLNIYIRNDVEKQLLSTAELLSENFNKDLSKAQLITGTDEEYSKSLLKLNRILREKASYLDINFFILNEDKAILFPKNLKGKKGNEISGILDKLNSKNEKKVYANDTDKKYVALLYPMEFIKEKENGYLVLYSDLEKKNGIVRTINLIIVSIVTILSIIAFILSKRLSKNIAKPILDLRDMANNIGNKNYIKKSTANEINEIKELENAMNLMAVKLEESDKVMNTFFQNASHDLRTPLMSIQGYAEGIKYDVLENKDEGIEIIISETKRLSKLVDELLILSKLDSMDNFYYKDALDIKLIMSEIVETSKGLALLEGKKIIFNGLEKEAFINASEDMISRAILNIISNCIRYSKSEVIIEAKIIDNKFSLEIMDDGVGIEDNEIDKIFNRFFKGKSGDNGLGLTISKGIIEALGGQIKCNNRDTGGACFTLILNVVRNKG